MIFQKKMWKNLSKSGILPGLLYRTKYIFMEHNGTIINTSVQIWINVDFQSRNCVNMARRLDLH